MGAGWQMADGRWQERAPVDEDAAEVGSAGAQSQNNRRDEPFRARPHQIGWKGESRAKALRLQLRVTSGWADLQFVGGAYYLGSR